MAKIDNRKWYLRKSNRGGYCYLFYRYSNSRNIRITHNPASPLYYFVEVHFAGKGKQPYLLVNPSTKTNEFTSIELAFKAANKEIENWDKPLEQDNRLVNPIFKRFASENAIDNWPLKE